MGFDVEIRGKNRRILVEYSTVHLGLDLRSLKLWVLRSGRVTMPRKEYDVGHMV
jgi:hypothetical protein